MTEVYSPVRVAAMAAKFGLTQGTSFDVTDCWDFSKGSHRTSAWKLIKEQDPYCIIGSPPCTMFSMLQELTKSVKKNDPAWCRHEEFVAQATRHIDVCCGLYMYQLKRGKHFIHEPPWSARS